MKERLMIVLDIIKDLVFFFYTMIYYLIGILIWALLALFDMLALIPFFFVWLFTGKKYWFIFNDRFEKLFQKFVP